MSKIIFAIVLTLMVSGCSTFQGNPRDVTVVADRIDVCSKPPTADKIVMRNVDFVIIEDKHGIYWIAVTPKFYENLAINMKEITQHIKQKNAIIKYYESCHKEKAPVDKDKKEE